MACLLSCLSCNRLWDPWLEERCREETACGPDMAADPGQDLSTVLPVRFSTSARIPAGTYPISVALGDFNSDNKTDLAIANNSNPSSFSVMLGDGVGGFGAPTTVTIPAKSFSRSIAAADLNGDTKLDLVIANSASNEISLLMGNGMGGFGSPIPMTVGATPIHVAVADYRSSGKLDIAVANQSSNNVSVLLGNGLGSFTAAATFPVGSGPYALAARDLNGDGKADVVTANASGGDVSVLLSDGVGGFGRTNFLSSQGSSSPSSVTIGDLNGDLIPDLAIAEQSTGLVSVLLGRGDGGFGAGTTYPSGEAPWAVEVADWNGDGKLDLAVANRLGSDVSVLLGNGVFGLGSAAHFPAGPTPYAMAVGDFNGDRWPDLVLCNLEANGSVTVLLNETR